MVKAIETSLRTLLEGSLQYQVPLYQRTYSWKSTQHKRLWDDIVKLAADRYRHPATTHFIGSVVLASSPANNPGDTARYLIVDGQQRLTTLTILLAAVRDHRTETEDDSHHHRINEQFLLNKWAKGQPLKLLPTQKDREAYSACIHASERAESSHPIGDAYRYFRTALLNPVGDDEEDVRIDQIEDAILNGLALVSIVAEAGDNVHRIFESLNNTGLRLTQGDLIRNYLFMRLPSRAEEVYEKYWRPLENRLDSQQLELLFWLDLVQRTDNARQGDTYTLQQLRLNKLQSEEDVVAEVERFARLGRLMYLMLNPSEEGNPEVRRSLERLNAWGTVTAYPLMLHLLERRDSSELTSAQVSETLDVVISYLVRRLLIGRATMNLNRTLLRTVHEAAGGTDPVTSIRTFLSTGRKYFASDRAIRESIETTPFYFYGKAPQRKLLLQWLEESHRSKEAVDPSGLTVEHIMPQTPTDDWRDMLADGLDEDENVDTVYQSLLHTIGNLTLTGYNSELSNSPFAVKREKFKKSGLVMNIEIAECRRWGRDEIVNRSKRLADSIITLFPGPVDSPEEASTTLLWANLDVLLAGLPAGRWTTYGDVALVLGTHAVPLGNRLANHPVRNAHRVLRSDGRIAENFRWSDPARDLSPRQVLEAEGLRFTPEGLAEAAQRLSIDELVHLSGLDVAGDSHPEWTGEEREDDFWAQMSHHQAPEVISGVRVLLASWRHLGGSLMFGSGETTSCFLLLDPTERRPWPFTLYPTGRIEVVFQHLAQRPPFDEMGLRQAFLDRLNAISGIDLPKDHLEKRPSISLAHLANPDSRDSIIEALAWFRETASSSL